MSSVNLVVSPIQLIGRVGERATTIARPTLPSSNRRCRFPASGSPESSRLKHAQYPTDEPAPTAPSAASVGVDGPERSARCHSRRWRVPEGKVVHPTLQMPVQLSDPYRDWLMALMTVCHFAQLLPLALDRLIRRDHIQVFPITSFQIAVVPKRVAQKVQTCSFLPQVHDLRFCG